MYKLSCIINVEHIFLSFGIDLHGQSSCHLYMAFQNMTSGHVKGKKGTGHVFYMATPSHATESVKGELSVGCRLEMLLLASYPVLTWKYGSIK